MYSVEVHQRENEPVIYNFYHHTRPFDQAVRKLDVIVDGQFLGQVQTISLARSIIAAYNIDGRTLPAFIRKFSPVLSHQLALAEDGRPFVSQRALQVSRKLFKLLRKA